MWSLMEFAVMQGQDHGVVWGTMVAQLFGAYAAVSLQNGSELISFFIMFWGAHTDPPGVRPGNVDFNFLFLISVCLYSAGDEPKCSLKAIM